MEYFENTTRLTEEGYLTVLRMTRRKQFLVYRILSAVLMLPLAERLLFFLIMRITAGTPFQLKPIDILFALLLIAGLFLWTVPARQIREKFSRTRQKIDLQAVNQYTFLPEEIRMMTTSSLEKYRLQYQELTWVRSNAHWIVLRFEKRGFTMLVDKASFTRGSAADCLAFLRRKINEG